MSSVFQDGVIHLVDVLRDFRGPTLQRELGRKKKEKSNNIISSHI